MDRLSRRTRLSVALFLGVLTMTGASQAMTTGTPPDGNGHPAVVALLRSYDGVWTRPYCTGTLLSGKVVLTASHCLWAAQYYQQQGWQLSVSNDATLNRDQYGWLEISSLTTNSTVSQIVLNPAYNPKLLGGYDHDVSALVLANDIDLDPSALPTLPPIGILNQLKKSGYLKTATFNLLGYGSEQQTVPNKGGPLFPFTSERRNGVVSFDSLDTRFIHENQRVSQGWNGACYGDSGGPTLLQQGQTSYVMGVTSSGDRPCFATNTASRTDTVEANNLLTTVLANNPDDNDCVVAECLQPKTP